MPAVPLPENFMPSSTGIWVGPGRHAVVYWARGMELLNFGGFVAFDEWTAESWTLKAPLEDVSRDHEGWHKSIHTISEAVDRDSCHRRALNDRAPTCQWSTGRATLLGDAVLARALAETDWIAPALIRFQQARVEPCARIVNQSTANQTMYHLPPPGAFEDL